MAKIIGNIKNIKKEEQVILNLINNNLNEEYYIFYKPFLNGEIPDVVILKRHGGICIINISYINPKYILGVNNKENSVILNNNNKIKNPIKKINEQKYNMFNYHIESLNKAKIKCEGALALVQPFIVFVNGIKRNIDKYFRDKYVSMYGLDEMQKLVNDIKIKSNRSSKYFTDEMFNESYKKLSGKADSIDYHNEISLSKRQKELVISKAGQSKIKGFAGCGKTMVLVYRVINHIKRIKKEENRCPKVLILTYNITLRRYILGNIQKISGMDLSNNIQIIHYHKFLSDKCNFYNVPNSSYEDEDIFQYANITEEEKYDGIFIDEIQDYLIEWQNILLKNFLKKNGEYVVFGDEKQNIYERELEYDNTVRTNIRGRWNVIAESHRLTGKIVDLAMNFQRKFLKDKYMVDNFETLQGDIFALDEVIEYIPVFYDDLIDVSNEIRKCLRNQFINANKTIILGEQIETLRKIEKNLRDDNLNHILTFETEEEYECIKNNAARNHYSNYYKTALYEIRKCRKYNFAASRGLKFSTIHSFKGWQEETVILIINDSSKNTESELIYTALTRCVKNLIIIDCSLDKKYKDFFESYI